MLISLFIDDMASFAGVTADMAFDCRIELISKGSENAIFENELYLWSLCKKQSCPFRGTTVDDDDLNLM